jgi:hypothetical protein
MVGAVAYAPIESGAFTLEKIREDLLIARDIGFRIVKLWNTPQLLDRGLFFQTLNVLRELGFSVFIPLCQPTRSWRIFPKDEEANKEFENLLVRVAEIIKDSSANILWVEIYMPPSQYKRFPEYKEEIEKEVELFLKHDPKHQVKLFTDDNPSTYPTEWSGRVKGFGVQPYSLIKDDIDRGRIDAYIDYFAKTGKTVHVDEYGFRTVSMEGVHGMASNQFIKGDLIVEFIRYVEEKYPGMIWTYFMLIDRIGMAEGDWGLLDINRVKRYAAFAVERELSRIKLTKLTATGILIGVPVALIGAAIGHHIAKP